MKYNLKTLRDQLRDHGWRIQKVDFPQGSNPKNYRWYVYKPKAVGRYFPNLLGVSVFLAEIKKDDQGC
jgi:hypothetical protein